MSEEIERAKAMARQLARSGKFVGWRAVAFELQFQPGFANVVDWLSAPETHDELDFLCHEARSRRRDLEAA